MYKILNVLTYSVTLLVFILLYLLSFSKRSFVNWLFDKIKGLNKSSFIKENAILFLLLDAKERSETDTIEVCLNVFEYEIANSSRLTKLAKKVRVVSHKS
jgi:hypothetical protein